MLHGWPERVSSALARVEVLRAARRAAIPPRSVRRAEQVLERIALVRLDDEVLEKAALLRPLELRSLDALHLATALSLGRDLGAFLTYDPRLERAARSLRLAVVAPS